MNKKFSTLMAGLLLAGGVFSTANASNWTTDDTYVQNTGKYFGILRGQTNNSGAGWIDRGEFLTYNSSSETFEYVPNWNDKNSYWTISTREVNGATEYQLTNANGVVFKYNKVEWFRIEYATNGQDVNVLYYFDDNNNKTYLTNSTGSLVYGFSNVEIAEEPIPAADLNAELNGAFQLNFKNYTSLEGNVFTGNLKAVPTGTSSFSTTYYLTNGDGRYIVLDNEDVWSTNTANLDGRERSAYSGYKFKTLSEHAFAQLADKSNATFTFYKSYDFNDTDSLIVTLPNAYVADGPSATPKHQLTTANDKGLRLYIATVSNVNYLTAIEYDKANDRLAVQQDDDYPTDGTDPYEVGALAPYIELGASNIVDFKKFAGKVWNITDENGNVLTPKYIVADIDSYAEMFAPKEQVDLTTPEGHWLPFVNNYGFSFVNRESGEYWDIYNGWVIRSTNTPNKYEIYNSRYSWADEEYSVYITEAKNAELGNTEKGYKIFDMDEESVNGKYFSFETSLGVTAYIGKDADENVILTTDKDDAIEFRIKELTHDFKDHDGLAGVDTLMHFTTYSKLDANNNWAVDQDTVQFYHYALYDNFSEKYLQYNSQTKKFELTTWGGPQNNHEDFDLYEAYYAFVVKEKADGTNILVRAYDIDYDWCNTSTGSHVTQLDKYGNKFTFDNYFETNLGYAHKLYAATQPGTVADMACITTTTMTVSQWKILIK